MAPWRAEALRRGYRSAIALPLKDESANAFGSLNIYSAEPNAFTAEEIRLLEELAGDLAFGVTRVARPRRSAKHVDQRLQANLHFFECMDQINLAIQETKDLDADDEPGSRLDAFDLRCDRAWLVYPCDPEAATWRVPMERTRPEYPGTGVHGLEIPTNPEIVSPYGCRFERPRRRVL